MEQANHPQQIASMLQVRSLIQTLAGDSVDRVEVQRRNDRLWKAKDLRNDTVEIPTKEFYEEKSRVLESWPVNPDSRMKRKVIEEETVRHRKKNFSWKEKNETYRKKHIS